MRLSIRSAAVSATLSLFASLAHPAALRAQTRGFLVRLGVDTFAVERFTRTGNTVHGEVVRHTPSTTVLRYTLTFDGDGGIASYEEGVYEANGAPVPNTPQGVAQTGMKMTFIGDRVVRTFTQRGELVELRNAAPRPTIPQIGGSSPYWQELAIQTSKRSGAPYFRFFTFAASQDTAFRFDVRTINPDSVEIVAGGFPRAFRLDARGHVLRGDGARSTLKLLITPIADANIAAIATAWAAKDAAGLAMGVPSTRDTVNAKVGDATVWIDYGRPAKRGRRIWGALVPFDTVWRFGANAAAQLRTDRNLDVGGVTVPAGFYSLLLLPSAGRSYLIVNKETGKWGTTYDASQDLVKIPVQHHSGAPAGEERFRVLVADGKLMMLWDDGGYDVPIRPRF
jgi:hypothetical protein